MEEYLNKQTSINDRAEERNIISGISKRQFFNTMKENEIDFEEVILKIKSGNAHFHKFNYLVRNLKSENNLNLIKCAIYLYQDFFIQLTTILFSLHPSIIAFKPLVILIPLSPVNGGITRMSWSI